MIKINKKIMAIIVSDKNNYLLLKTNPKHMKVNEWFVVTGSVKKNERYKSAVKREVMEETKLKIKSIKETKTSFDYEWPKNSGKMHHEKVFLVKVKETPIKITKWEHLAYKWLKKKRFIELISWKNKEILRKILK